MAHSALNKPNLQCSSVIEFGLTRTNQIPSSISKMCNLLSIFCLNYVSASGILHSSILASRVEVPSVKGVTRDFKQPVLRVHRTSWWATVTARNSVMTRWCRHAELVAANSYTSGKLHMPSFLIPGRWHR